ncbi:MAG: GNAT family N-acetyltransferase [Calditrichaeota bacterium]|nr:GNAT family N-acetyltransferase [Calditrichota bacterium]
MSDSKYRVCEITLENEQEWRQLLSHTQPPILFHEPEFIRIVAEVFSFSPQLIVIVKGETPIGGTVMWKRTRWGQHLGITPFYVLYNPIRMLTLATYRTFRQVENLHDVAVPLLQWVESQYRVATLSTHPSFGDVRPFLWRHWQVQVRYTACLSLPWTQTSVERMDPEHHRLYRRAQERTEWRFVTDGDPAALWELIQKNYAQDGLLPPIQKKEFLRFAHEIQRAQKGEVFSIQSEKGNVLAATLVLRDASTGYGLFLGRQSGHDGNLASIRLLVQTAEYLSAMGLTQFDLGGAMVPSIARFKLQLGADLVPYFHCQWTRGSIIRLALAFQNWRNRRKRRIVSSSG